MALAQALTDRCSLDRVFFGNSGAEVNEGAIKLARLLPHVGRIRVEVPGQPDKLLQQTGGDPINATTKTLRFKLLVKHMKDKGSLRRWKMRRTV